LSSTENQYSAKNIKILEGIHAVRKRPGMYIGDTTSSGLHHILYEIVDNSMDEVLAGFGSVIMIKKSIENIISIQDAGRGIPTEIHPQTGVSTLETVLTVLHAGGKFDKDSYAVSGGLHGVGSVATNALSEWMTADVCTNGFHYHIKFIRGVAEAPMQKLKPCSKTGTMISFKPDEKIFKDGIKFSDEILRNRFIDLAYLNTGLKIIYKYEVLNEDGGIEEIEEVYQSETGLEDFIEHELNGKPALIKTKVFSKKQEDIPDNEKSRSFEIAINYSAKSFEKKIKCYTNNIYNEFGGDHEQGFTRALHVAITQKMNERKDNSAKDITIDDTREGLFAIISYKEYEPQFKGQTKGTLNSPEGKSLVYAEMKNQLLIWLEENPKDFDKIVKKAESARKGREAAKKSREAARKNDINSMVGILPTKLADCQSKDPEESEIYLVEGDSAGGSGKQARNRITQAIMPLKGKILNVMKHPKEKAQNHEEIGSMITAFGCGFDKTVDLTKIRYHKIIIMTDADIDGGHIETLLFLAFFKYWRPIIEAGYLYIAIPPLYRMSKGSEYHYFKDDIELDKWIAKKVSSKYKRSDIDRILDQAVEDYADIKGVPVDGLLDYAINEHIEQLGLTSVINILPQVLEQIKETVLDEIDDVREEAMKEIQDKVLKGWMKSRFKGLGEMNPSQLKETAMNPETRVIKQVTLSDEGRMIGDMFLQLSEDEVSDVLTLLGADDSAFRRWFLLNFTKDIGLDKLDI